MAEKIVERTANGVKARISNKNAPKPAVNGADEPTIATINEQFRTLSGLIQRAQLASMAGLQYGGARDLYQVFGYKKVLTTDDFIAKYMRQDIASRIIDAPPAATWANPPIITTETHQTAWKELDRSVKLFSGLYRADRLARLNHFSLLVFGFDDSSSLERPLNPDRVNELLYVKAIGSRLVKEVTFNNNVRDKRYGFPDMYRVAYDDPKMKTVTSGQIAVKGTRDVSIHHTRCVHIVENALEDEVFGTPIIEKVYNLLDDLLKVAGGTSETYWLTGNRGLQANVDKEMEISPEDAKALSDEIDEYMHQLRRFIRTRGVDLNVLESKTPNPKEVFEMIIALISGTTGIPKRILLGSEAGQLASEQDRANWAERMEERRRLFANPNMLEPTVDILQSVGLLPEGEVEFEWPSAFILSPLEAAQTMAQTARAIGNISRQTGNKVPMQLTSREEAREILGLKGDLAEEDILETEPETTPDDSLISPARGAAPGTTEETEEETTQTNNE